MNVKALQRADRWAGIPLCFALSVARRLFREQALDCSCPPRRLLFVKLAEQGSTVLAYPALRRAVELVGRENVYFLTFEDNRLILDVLGMLPESNVVTVCVGSVWSFFWSMLKAVRRLRSLKCDSAVDLEFFSRGSAVLTYLSGGCRRVGFHASLGGGPYRGDLMTHRLRYHPHLHTSQSFLSLVEALLWDPAALPAFDVNLPGTLAPAPRFVPSPDERTQLSEILGSQTGVRSPLILLNPNSGDLLPLRRWPSERYAELARRLLAKYAEINVAFTGAPNEAEATTRLVRQVASGRCISLAGKTTLRQLLVLYTLADVLVTNDSGPAHFATLTPIRVVTLFGPETPVLFAAPTPRNTVLWPQLPCSPCVSAYNNRQSACRDNQCMQAITVDEVFGAVCRAFESKTQPVTSPAIADLPVAV
jgi:ADP-heptose:LPS heptosyltransferase